MADLAKHVLIMNKSFRFLFAVPVMLLLLTAVTSCTMQKRLYRPGYHIETTRAGKTKTAKSDETTAAIAAEKEQVTDAAGTAELQIQAVPNLPETIETGKAETAGTHTVPAVITESPAAEDTTKQQVQPRSKKSPVHPRIRTAAHFTGMTYIIYILFALIGLLYGAALAWEAVIYVLAGALLFGVLLIVSTMFVIDGLRQLKEQKEDKWRGKKLAWVLLALNALPFLLFAVFLLLL